MAMIERRFEPSYDFFDLITFRVFMILKRDPGILKRLTRRCEFKVSKGRGHDLKGF